ncbi:MAG: class I SAM-dependent methyltransferase [Caulobacteraceae bacterium]
MKAKEVSAEVAKQRAYYAATAELYDAKHVSHDDEHAQALALLSGFAGRTDHASFLDIGAGTGRGIRALRNAFPDARIVGVEPVAELRATGLATGDLGVDTLIDGDATALEFEGDAFDWVVETGVLHHVRISRPLCAKWSVSPVWGC